MRYTTFILKMDWVQKEEIGNRKSNWLSLKKEYELIVP